MARGYVMKPYETLKQRWYKTEQKPREFENFVSLNSFCTFDLIESYQRKFQKNQMDNPMLFEI